MLMLVIPCKIIDHAAPAVIPDIGDNLIPLIQNQADNEEQGI